MAAERFPSPLLGSGCAAALTLGALACVQLPQLPPLDALDAGDGVLRAVGRAPGHMAAVPERAVA